MGPALWVGDRAPHHAKMLLLGEHQLQPSRARSQMLPGMCCLMRSALLISLVKCMKPLPCCRAEGQRSRRNGLCPPPSPGAVRHCWSSHRHSPRCSPGVRRGGRAVTAGLPVPCGARCSGRAGCWPPAACWVPRAAAGSGAAPAGTTPAGPSAPAGPPATATRTARGRETAATATWPCAAVPVSGRGMALAGHRLCCCARWDCLLLAVSPVL